MKRLFVLLSLASIALTSCSSNIDLLTVNPDVTTYSSTSASSTVTTVTPVTRLYENYIASISAEDLEKGDCVQRAQEFYNMLKNSKTDVTNARIILAVREPSQSSYGIAPQPMVPDPAFVRGEPVSFWIWHAFVLYDGHVYDPKYKQTGDTIETYYKNFWKKNDKDDFWVFSVKPETLPEITGSPYPGAKPRMFNFQPINFNDLIKDPLYITKRWQNNLKTSSYSGPFSNTFFAK